MPYDAPNQIGSTTHERFPVKTELVDSSKAGDGRGFDTEDVEASFPGPLGMAGVPRATHLRASDRLLKFTQGNSSHWAHRCRLYSP
jgi:hypothetical protein